MEMRKNGTGIYYKPGLALNHESQIMADIGLHFDSITQTIIYYGYSSRNRSIYMEISGGYRRELFKKNILGAFCPVFTCQGGSAIKLNRLSWNNIPENWILMSALGTGFQFYNGKILNEMLLKLNQYFSKDRNISFQLSIYWI